MAKRFTPPPKPRPAKLTPLQVRAAIPKLERRLAELKGFDADALTDDDHAVRVTDLEDRNDATLVDIFGNDTADYQRYRVHSIDGSPITMFGPSMFLDERKQYIKRGLADAIGRIESTISILRERLEDTGETAA